MPTNMRRLAGAIACAGLILAASLIVTQRAQPAEAVTCTIQPGSVVYAEACTGTNAGQKIATALGVLGLNSGTIDARGIHGGDITQPLVLGSPWNRSVSLLMGPGRFYVSATITVLMQSSIVGAPVGMAVGGTDLPATNLIAKNAANLSSVVQVGDGTSPGGFGSVIQDVVIDGNKSAAGTAGTGALVLVRGGRVELERVTAQNGGGDGIRITGGAVDSCCAKLSNVMSILNARSGLRLVSLAGGPSTSNDPFVVQSEFLGNGLYGIELNSTGALRVTNSDLSGNSVGLWTDWTSGNINVTNTQFGDQSGHDIQTSAGSYHVISANTFLGSANRVAGNSAIQLNASTGSSVTGNTIVMNGGAGAPLAFGIQFVGGAGNLVSGNVISGGTTANAITGASNSSGGLTPLQLNLVNP